MTVLNDCLLSLSLSIYQPNAEDLIEDPRSIRDGEATRFRRLLTEHLNCYIIEKVLCVFVGIKPLKCGFVFFIAITLTPYSMCCAQTLSHVQLFATPWTVAHQSMVHLCPWDPLSKNTGMGCHFLLQGIFQTQASNQGSFISYTDRQILYH